VTETWRGKGRLAGAPMPAAPTRPRRHGTRPAVWRPRPSLPVWGRGKAREEDVFAGRPRRPPPLSPKMEAVSTHWRRRPLPSGRPEAERGAHEPRADAPVHTLGDGPPACWWSPLMEAAAIDDDYAAVATEGAHAPWNSQPAARDDAESAMCDRKPTCMQADRSTPAWVADLEISSSCDSE